MRTFAKLYNHGVNLYKAPLLLLVALYAAMAQTALPKSWIDPDTGHRAVRLTYEPNSASLYFNQNGYSADGKKMVYTTPEGISVPDLENKATKSVVKGRVGVIVTGHKTQNVYYTRDNAVFSTDVNTLATREIAKLPAPGSVSTVNADETLLAGTYIVKGLPGRKSAASGRSACSLRPDTSFTHDRKWLVFRSNMFGPTYALAVEVEKAEVEKAH